jgi:phage FluMu protein Com
MPITVVCRSCSARLNAPDTAAGKRVKCPKCAAVLTVPAPTAADDDFEVVDDEPAPPKRRPAVVDDDADEDDDRPPRKRSRRGEEDDEDEDDRPRPKKKKGKKAAPKSNLLLILGIGGGILLVAVVGVVLAVVWNKDETAKATGNPSGDPGVVRPTPYPRPGPAGDQPNPDWEVFEQPAFRIQVPKGGQPPQRNAQAEGAVTGQFPGGQVWAKAGPTGTAYLMFVLPMPAQLKQELDRDRDAAMRNFAAGMAAGVPGANVVSNTEVTINGQAGRQLVVNVGPGKSVMRFHLGASAIVGANVVGPVQDENDPQAKPFFDSFQPK